MADQFRILFVCSANLCRSVTAEEFARRRADRCAQPAEWLFASAGTNVRAGNVLPPEIANAMRGIGVSVDRPPAAVDGPFVRSADLILTAERSHRSLVARQFPYAVGYTFTLLQFARLAAAGRQALLDSGVPPSDELLELARIGRSSAPPGDEDDIADPVATRSATDYNACAALIETALDQIFID